MNVVSDGGERVFVSGISLSPVGHRQGPKGIFIHLNSSVASVIGYRIGLRGVFFHGGSPIPYRIPDTLATLDVS